MEKAKKRVGFSEGGDYNRLGRRNGGRGYSCLASQDNNKTEAQSNICTDGLQKEISIVF